jgi:hypothetical protein
MVLAQGSWGRDDEKRSNLEYVMQAKQTGDWLYGGVKEIE